MRLISLLVTLVLIGGGGLYVWKNHPEVRNWVLANFDTGTEFPTLEVRFSGDQIMEANRKELLKGEQYTYR